MYGTFSTVNDICRDQPQLSSLSYSNLPNMQLQLPISSLVLIDAASVRTIGKSEGFLDINFKDERFALIGTNTPGTSCRDFSRYLEECYVFDHLGKHRHRLKCPSGVQFTPLHRSSLLWTYYLYQSHQPGGATRDGTIPSRNGAGYERSWY